jgi:hypothetical protein
MPYYNVMVFGFQGPKAIWGAAQALGLTFSHEDDEDGVPITDLRTMTEILKEGCLDVEVPQALQARIDALFVQAVNGLPGYKHIGPGKGRIGHSQHIVETPFGRHASSGLQIGLAFDNFECDDTVEDAILGFYLTSRYQPAFLDLHDPYGGTRGVNPAHTAYIESLLKATFPAWMRGQTFVHQLFA